MRAIRLGAVEVTRVVEWIGPITSVDTLFPDTPPAAWSKLPTEHWQPDDRQYRAAIQTWVLRDGQTILIDTGVGNGRDRPQVPAFDHLDTHFLELLQAEEGSLKVSREFAPLPRLVVSEPRIEWHSICGCSCSHMPTLQRAPGARRAVIQTPLKHRFDPVGQRAQRALHQSGSCK